VATAGPSSMMCVGEVFLPHKLSFARLDNIVLTSVRCVSKLAGIL
jgi:hypothetical protein